MVWRCANRVEHGKEFCWHSPTISERKIKREIREKLGLDEFDEKAVKASIDFVSVQEDSTLEIEFQRPEFSDAEIA